MRTSRAVQDVGKEASGAKIASPYETAAASPLHLHLSINNLDAYIELKSSAIAGWTKASSRTIVLLVSMSRPVPTQRRSVKTEYIETVGSKHEDASSAGTMLIVRQHMDCEKPSLITVH